MASQRPKPRLYDALGAFGRVKGQWQLSVEQLEDEGSTILRAVGTPDQLADWYKRHDLAVWIEAALRSIVASIKDPVDCRIAQAVLKTEPEFFEMGVEERKQYLRERNHISDEKYKERRPVVIARVAAKLEEALATGVLPELPSEPTTAGNVRDGPTTGSELDTAHPARTQTATLERAPALITSRKRSGLRGRILPGLVAATLVLEMVAGAAVLMRHDAAETTWNGMTAAELERRYDGKLPAGQDGTDSHCADPPPSQPVDGASRPPVTGPAGTPIATVQLRKSPICPTVIWARVLWHGDERAWYQIPPGWTLHVVMHRADTNTVIDEPETSKPSEIPYALSRMLCSGAKGDIYYRDNDGYFVRLAIGVSDGKVLTVASGLPAWQDPSGGISGSTGATDNAVLRADGTGGATLQNSSVTIDDSGNLTANAAFGGFATTDMSGGTLTMAITDKQIQEFTGSTPGTNHTVKLPTTSVPAGAQYTIVNNNTSTGAVIVQSSNASAIITLAPSTSAVFTTVVATPTTAANWDYQYLGDIVASGKSLSVSNTLTLAGTDGTTMTFPSSNDTVVTLGATQTLTNKTLTTPKIASLYQDSIGGSNLLTMPAATDTLVGKATTDTLTNKWFQPRGNSTTSSATPSINTDTTDEFDITALATNITSMTTNLTGTPVNGQRLLIRFKDNGTARTITWGTSYVSTGAAALIATTVLSKTHYVGLIYDSTAAKWACIAADATGYY